MSIDKNFDSLTDYYILSCDICGDECDEEFYDFYEAVEYKKDRTNGWESRKTEYGWDDVCPECRETAHD